MNFNRAPFTDCVDTFVGLALDIDLAYIAVEKLRQVISDFVFHGPNLWALANHGGVHI